MTSDFNAYNGLYVVGSDSNTVMNSYMANANGFGAMFNTNTPHYGCTHDNSRFDRHGSINNNRGGNNDDRSSNDNGCGNDNHRCSGTAEPTSDFRG